MQITERRDAERVRTQRFLRRRGSHERTPSHRRPLPLSIADAAGRANVNDRDRRYRFALACADAVAIAAVIAVVFGLASEAPLEPLIFLAVPLVLLLNKVAGLYDRDELLLNKTTLDEAPALLQMGGVHALMIWLLHAELSAGTVRPVHVLVFWLGGVVALMLGRTVARVIARRTVAQERCLLIGAPESLSTLENKLRSPHIKADVVAAVPMDPLEAPLSSDDFRVLVRELDVDRVIFAPSSADAHVLDFVRLAKSAGVRVSVLPRLFEVVGSAVEFDQLDGLVVLGVRRFGLTRSSRGLKRSFDLLGAGVIVALLSPVIAVIAAAIRLESHGPVLFRQTRIGRDGRPFQIFKFRSMVADAETQKANLRHLNEASGLFKIAEDPRITRVGRFIRRTSLDELPQLFNVLRGEMSLVGPRPLVTDEDAMVEGAYRERLHLLPGMTGHWQILGSSRIPMEEMVSIDYLYVASWSLWTDLKILLRTVPYVLSRRGL